VVLIIIIIINTNSSGVIGVALVWYYLVLAIGITTVILFGCCVAIDYSTYRSLQRRLREERRRKLEEKHISAFA
jgi:hypothetical protein